MKAWCYLQGYYVKSTDAFTHIFWEVERVESNDSYSHSLSLEDTRSKGVFSAYNDTNVKRNFHFEMPLSFNYHSFYRLTFHESASVVIKSVTKHRWCHERDNDVQSQIKHLPLKCLWVSEFQSSILIQIVKGFECFSHLAKGSKCSWAEWETNTFTHTEHIFYHHLANALSFL